MTSYRLTSIDLLRGLVMIIMALDHTRDFFHIAANTGDPLDLATTTPVLFFTRFITHYCAPVFVFLAGTSAFLQSQRKPKKELSFFLIKRGLWLILVEAIIISFLITFDVHYGLLTLQTIWAIGISMVILGLVIWLPYYSILTLGLLIVLGHNSLDNYEAGHTGPYSIPYAFLHHFKIIPIGGGHAIGVFYPFLSWAGLMMIGYCIGKWYTDFDAEKRRTYLIWTGVGLLLLFAIVRYTNLYGDPDPWSVQRSGLYTFLSFINVHKYPPSLLYMCITIAPALLFLAVSENIHSRLASIITVYGRVPFLYYILHFFILHLLTMLAFLSRGHSFAEGMAGSGIPLKFVVPGEGFSLGVVYLIWISVVIALYPVCKWFSNYKKNHRDWWLSYL
jgi:uncharacterized membrane protein